jgi:hypothetical protein
MTSTPLTSQIPRYAHVLFDLTRERDAAANIERVAPWPIGLFDLWMVTVPSAVQIQEIDENLEGRSIDQIDG